MKFIQAGLPRPLGADEDGARGQFRAVLEQCDPRGDLSVRCRQRRRSRCAADLPARTGDIWHGLVAPRRAGPGTHYAYYVHGPNDPENGHRFDASVGLDRPVCARSCRRGSPLRSRVIDGSFDWGGDRPPAIPWRDTLIYELHVKGFTQLHPAVPAQWRGKYLGLTVAAVIEHLKSIGVTAVELLPCQSFVSEPVPARARPASTTGATIRWPGSRRRTNTPCTMPSSSSRPW